MSLPFDFSTDVVAPDYRVYIEGVQVPFEGFTINSGMGTMPQADLQVPAAPFLMDIARYYSPKVHIFYYDRFSSRADPFKLLFSGFINQAQYRKSTENNSYNITFSCSHKYTVLEQILLDYVSAQDPNFVGSQGVVTETIYSSLYQSAKAMQGISLPPSATEVTLATSSAGTADPSVCPTFLSNQYGLGQFTGLPGVAVNLWQQIKQGAYAVLNKNPTYEGTFFSLYKPLVEGNYYDFGKAATQAGGLQFFQRLTGHAIVENALNTAEYTCGTKTIKGTLIPPSYYSVLGGASQVEMVIRNLSNFTQSLGDQASFLNMLGSAYEAIDYDMLFLASPVVGPQGNIYDTLVKPRLPFYYSPSCNVYYPTMYDTLTVTYDEYSTPTRLTVISQEALQTSKMLMAQYRSPPEWRSAIAQAYKGTAGTAADTLAGNFGAFSIFEQGKGVISSVLNMPQWLNYYHQTKTAQPAYVNQSVASQNESLFSQSWQNRYGSSDQMNPYSSASKLQPYQQLLMASTDSFYTQQVAKQKMGSVEGPFNPYITPGYSMDILDASPVAPSFHGLCISVTHAVDAHGSARTVANFVSAMTYSELANYYYPMISPWLQLTLGLVPNPTIVNNPSGVAAANSFYSTLGGTVSCAPPELIYDFSLGRSAPVNRSGNVLSAGSTIYTPTNPSQTYEGGLYLNFREIESKADIEQATGLKFIDMVSANYSSTVAEYTDPKVNSPADTLLSLGHNQFLDYVSLNDIFAHTTKS